jgi:phosphoglycerate dehydrogenase-like enzyme
MKKIFITPRSFPIGDDRIRRMIQEHELQVMANETGRTLSEQEMKAMVCGTDGIIVGLDPVTESVMKSAPKLKSISKYGAGLDNIDLEMAKELGVTVSRTKGANATSVAEHAVCLCFALARSIYPALMSVKAGEWKRMRGVELKGKTIGIIGFGQIGREVARISDGIGMNVIVHDPYVDDLETVSLENLLKRSDFVTLHLPLTSRTEHLMHQDTLAQMRRSAYLINTSRGGLVDESALYDALVSGVIAGAASDVFSTEPPEKHRLLELGNFLLTPHIGAYTQEAVARMAEEAMRNLIDSL